MAFAAVRLKDVAGVEEDLHMSGRTSAKALHTTWMGNEKEVRTHPTQIRIHASGLLPQPFIMPRILNHRFTLPVRPIRAASLALHLLLTEYH